MLPLCPHRPARRFAVALVILGSLAVLSACGASASRSSSEGTTTVLAAFYPLAWLSERIGGPDAQVADITPPGAEPHDLELTPRQVVEVGEADLVVYLEGLQPAVDDAVRQHASQTAFDAAAQVELLSAAEVADEDGHGDEHAEEGGHQHGPAGSSVDPHLWLDPVRFATVATKLGDRFAQIDPVHADEYHERAEDVVADLDALDRSYREGLATCRDETMVTSHAAFGYLAERYELHQVPISGLDPEAEPSPGRLAEVARVAEEEGVRTIFFETLVDPKVAQVLAQEVGAETAVLDPVEGLSRDSSDDYLSVMGRNLETLRTALGCS